MGDVLFLLLVAGFFAVTVAYVRGCAVVVGPDLTGAPTDEHTEAGA